MKTNELWQLLNRELADQSFINNLPEGSVVIMNTKPIITPAELMSSYRTGTLVNINKTIITQTLGFEPNREDDPDKVVSSWAFEVDGKPAAIWDYKGSHMHGQYSVYDPHNVLGEVFDSKFIGGF